MKRNFLGLVVLGMFLLAFVSPTTANSGGESLEFEVFLNDKKIGMHRFEMSTDSGVREVRSTANFKYTVFFIPAYRYQHSNVERWQGDCLLELKAETDANGKRVAVKGEKGENGFWVDDGELKNDLPTCIMSFAYWNSNMLSQQRLLNQQTGEYVDVAVRKVGTEPFNVRGESVSAERYELTSEKARLTLWYSSDNEWLGLESVAKGGQIIRYELS